MGKSQAFGLDESKKRIDIFRNVTQSFQLGEILWKVVNLNRIYSAAKNTVLLRVITTFNVRQSSNVFELGYNVIVRTEKIVS